MKPWRAALTSATASGNSTRIASRSAIDCSSAEPLTCTCASAADVSSTAVLSVSVANCSRCASCTDSACCSANSRKPRSRSSGSPPNGKPKPPSMEVKVAVLGCRTPLRKLDQIAAFHVLDERVDDGGRAADRVRDRLAASGCGQPELVQKRRRRDARLVRAAAAELHGELAHRDDRRGSADVAAIGDDRTCVVQHHPAPLLLAAERDEIEPQRARRLRRQHPGDVAVLRRRRRNPNQILVERHTVKAMDAEVLFAPLGPRYDRYASLLSFGQDPRWRRFLVSRTEAQPLDTVLDVACGTAAVSLELVRQKDCFVVGLDRSAEMLDVGRQRVMLAGATKKIRLQEGDARALPFEDGLFDAVTFTYLLRYVEDPAATLRELARVLKPGGTLAGLEFAVPRGLWRPLWELWVRVGLPAAGRAIGHG